MLGRLDEAFDGQRRFVANASHELRTPLTVMRTEVEVTLADPQATVAELREMGITVREAIERSELLIESLLTLARSDAGDLSAIPVDLAMIVEATLEDHRDALDEAEIRARTQLEAAPVIGDPRLLERLVWNLVENGVRHNEGDWLTVSTRTVDSDVVLVVANGGRAIPPEIALTLLEPFRRSAERTGRGFGLGLSIVRAIARAHGGDARLQAPAEGGLLVEIVLPADAHAKRPTAPATPVVLARG